MPKEIQDRYDPGSFTIASKQFEDSALLLNEFVREEVKSEPNVTDPKVLSRKIKNYAKYLGAVLVGMTKLDQDYASPVRRERNLPSACCGLCLSEQLRNG